MLKWISEKYDVIMKTGLESQWRAHILIRINGNEPLSSSKYVEYFDQISNYQLPSEDEYSR
jgi:hypothetical protein